MERSLMLEGLPIVNLRNCEKGEYLPYRMGNRQNWWPRCLGCRGLPCSVGWPAIDGEDGDALDARKRGGRPPKLTAKMLEWIYDTVAMKDPRQMKFPFALWTALMIAELIWRQYGIRLSKASVCRLLNQLGLSPQKPLWRAFQQDPERVEKWVKEEFPKIRALARKAEGGHFLWR